MTDTYRVRFICGALQGEWLHGQSGDDVSRLRRALAELCQVPSVELYHTGIAWDMLDLKYNAHVWRGVVPTTTQAACLYVMREFEE